MENQTQQHVTSQQGESNLQNTSIPQQLNGQQYVHVDPQQYFQQLAAQGVDVNAYYQQYLQQINELAQSGYYLQHPEQLSQLYPYLVQLQHAQLQGGTAQTQEEPIYVNAKQYHRILIRREQRAKRGKIVRRQYLHESRRKHALNRIRSKTGRFLKKEEIEALKKQGIDPRNADDALIIPPHKKQKLEEEAKSQTENQVPSQVPSQLQSQLPSQLQNQLQNQLQSQMQSQLQSQLQSQMQNQLQSQLQNEMQNQLQNQMQQNEEQNQLQNQVSNQQQEHSTQQHL